GPSSIRGRPASQASAETSRAAPVLLPGRPAAWRLAAIFHSQQSLAGTPGLRRQVLVPIVATNKGTAAGVNDDEPLPSSRPQSMAPEPDPSGELKQRVRCSRFNHSGNGRGNDSSHP